MLKNESRFRVVPANRVLTLLLIALVAIFLTVGACTSSQYSLSKNVGHQTLAYVLGGNIFLSDISITSDSISVNSSIQLTSDGNNESPIWSPDGNALVFAKRNGESRSLWTMNVETRKQVVVPNTTTTGTITLLSWSNDTHYLAFAKQEGVSQTFCVLDMRTQQVVELPTVSTTHPITPISTGAFWSPDNTMLLLAFNDSNNKPGICLSRPEKSFCERVISGEYPAWRPQATRNLSGQVLTIMSVLTVLGLTTGAILHGIIIKLLSKPSPPKSRLPSYLDLIGVLIGSSGDTPDYLGGMANALLLDKMSTSHGQPSRESLLNLQENLLNQLENSFGLRPVIPLTKAREGKLIVRYEPQRHEAIDNLTPGEEAQVLEVGWQLQLPDGKTIVLKKPVVQKRRNR